MITEEEPRDIHVVYEAPLLAKPVQPVPPSEFDDEDEIEVESDLEEEPMENEPVEDSDGTTIEDRMLRECEEKILELECRVEELET